jgi:hypothetical protein
MVPAGCWLHCTLGSIKRSQLGKGACQTDFQDAHAGKRSRALHDCIGCLVLARIDAYVLRMGHVLLGGVRVHERLTAPSSAKSKQECGPMRLTQKVNWVTVTVQ